MKALTATAISICILLQYLTVVQGKTQQPTIKFYAIHRIACNFRGVKIFLFRGQTYLNEKSARRGLPERMQCSARTEFFTHENHCCLSSKNFYPQKITRCITIKMATYIYFC